MTRYKNTELFFSFFSKYLLFIKQKFIKFVITVKWVHFIAKSKFNNMKILKRKKKFYFELAFNLKLVKSWISDVNNDVH